MRNGKKVAVLLDGAHHSMRFAHVAKKQDTEKDGFQLWKYLFFLLYFSHKIKSIYI